MITTGPCSIACAARLPGCKAVVSFAGSAPYHAEGLDFLAGQGEDSKSIPINPYNPRICLPRGERERETKLYYKTDIEEFGAALKGESALREFCEAQRKDFLVSDLDGVMEVMSTLLPPCDNEALIKNRDSIGQTMVDSFHEGLRISADGWIDDDLEMLKPWGYDLSEINVPVIIYQGTEDKMVPFAQGKWLADHLPQDKVKAHLLEGHGHISIFDGLDKVIDELLAAAA